MQATYGDGLHCDAIKEYLVSRSRDTKPGKIMKVHWGVPGEYIKCHRPVIILMRYLLLNRVYILYFRNVPQPFENNNLVSVAGREVTQMCHGVIFTNSGSKLALSACGRYTNYTPSQAWEKATSKRSGETAAASSVNGGTSALIIRLKSERQEISTQETSTLARCAIYEGSTWSEEREVQILDMKETLASARDRHGSVRYV